MIVGGLPVDSVKYVEPRAFPLLPCHTGPDGTAGNERASEGTGRNQTILSRLLKQPLS